MNILMGVTAAHAVDYRWTQGFGQGTTESIIRNGGKASVNIYCPAGSEYATPGIFLESRHVNLKTKRSVDVRFVIDGQNFRFTATGDHVKGDAKDARQSIERLGRALATSKAGYFTLEFPEQRVSERFSLLGARGALMDGKATILAPCLAGSPGEMSAGKGTPTPLREHAIPSQTPDALIRYVYAMLANVEAKGLTEGELRQVFTPQTASLVTAERKRAKAEADEAYDSPWFGSQEGKAINVTIETTPTGNATSIARVTFTNSFDAQDRVERRNFELENVPAQGWRIQDVIEPGVKCSFTKVLSSKPTTGPRLNAC